MARKPPHRPESRAKVEASGDPKAKTPMERFKGLTSHLLNVSREELQEQQRLYEKQKAHRKGKQPP